MPLTSPTPNAGQAATQFGAVGFYLHVNRVERVQQGVLLDLSFSNTSTQQQRVDNADFQLKGRSGNLVRHTVFEGCSNGQQRVDLYPRGMPASTPLRDPDGLRAGATYRDTICFPDPGDGPLTLVWEPDVAFGPLSEPINIPLR